MYIDLTVEVSPNKINFGSMLSKAAFNVVLKLKKDLTWHLGTHLDGMNRDFPIEYVERKAVVFDVRNVKDRDISKQDIDLERVIKDTCIVFYSGKIDANPYGSKGYFSKDQPQVSHELIDYLLEKEVSLIALDFAGIRRGNEHVPTDQKCADKGTFIIENVCNIGKVYENTQANEFTIFTFPAKYTGTTGLPCRVVAKI
jgi:kynurenine formamidase